HIFVLRVLSICIKTAHHCAFTASLNDTVIMIPMGSPRSIQGGVTVAKRWLSIQEANAALRPFYFAVHPDRFATMPDVRERNEKSLKIFNGYLNDLFPRPVLSSGKPIQVVFSIKEKGAGGRLRDVSLSLQGNDPVQLVRHALESCKLSTAHFKAQQQPAAAAASAGTTATGSSSMSMNEAASFYWGEYMKRKGGMQDIASILKKRREEAIEKTKQAESFRLTLKDEIEDLKWRTGCAAVVWQMEWAESHMRRCLSSLHRLLDHSSKEDRETMVTILLKNTIRFGRGSFICCDGGVQLGVDHVPEQWLKVCSEAAVRRQQLAQLAETRAAVSELLGGAEVIVPGHRGLGQTLQQLQTLAMRISSRELAIRRRIQAAGKNLMIEVATAYDELNLGQDGRLSVPCNVDVASLAAFLEEKGKLSKKVNEDAREVLSQLRRAKEQTVSSLRLSDLDWEDCLPLREVLDAVRRLEMAPEKMTVNLLGLHVRFSANPTVHVRNDGKVSMPLDWN
ncbi:hypothetical protein PMAYCL1PPCAC_00231, partial [Pristionchus mayeri]